MTPRFHPVNVQARRPDGDLARTLLQGLERPDPRRKPWGAFGSGVAAFLSLGALPVLLWHDRFRDFVDDERHHLRRFADWLRLNSTRPETMNLRVAGEGLGCRPLLSGLSILSVVAFVVLFAAHVGGDRPVVQQVLDLTYRFDATRPWSRPMSGEQQLFAAWVVGIFAAYVFHWMQVAAHASDVRRYVYYANEVLQAEGLPRVPMRRCGLGRSAVWLAFAVLLIPKGGWWGAALAVFGAVQQREVREESARLRRVLAARVRELARLPQADGTSPDDGGGATPAARRCPHARCLAALPPRAHFCPRCGHNAHPEPKTQEAFRSTT